MNRPGESGAPRNRTIQLSEPWFDGSESSRIAEALAGRVAGNGPFGQRVEARLEAMLGASRVLLTTSCTHALELALMALGVGPGEEVICPSFTFAATAEAMPLVGATPVFVDVNAEYLMEPALLEDAITPRTRAIIPVHLTGNPADMDAISAVAARHGLAVIEDAAQAVGASIGSRRVGSMGAAGAFSLFPLKNLGVAGDGGMLTTGSAEIADRVRLLRHHGLRNRDEVEVFGYNSRLDTLQAIVGDALLEGVDQVAETRRRHAQLYDRALAPLAPHVIVPPRRASVRQVFHTYVVQVEARDRLTPFLESRGVETKIHYPIPIHLQKAAESLGYKRGSFPVCEAQTERILSLPVHEYLTDDDLEYVVAQLMEFYPR